MAEITFTKNLTPANRSKGLQAIHFYWINSVLKYPPFYPITNEAGLIQFLDTKYPTFIEALGEMSFSMMGGAIGGEDEKIIHSMIDLAKRAQTNYPRPADFISAMMNYTGMDLNKYLQAAGETVSDLASSAYSASVSLAQGVTKYLPYIAGGVIALVLFLKLGGASAVASSRRSNPRKRK